MPGSTTIKLIFVFLTIWMLGSPVEASAGDKIIVKYACNGNQAMVEGEPLNGHTFIFNKNGVKELKITTLDWAPYIGKNICNQGWVQQLTIAMLASRGYKVISTFYPWARTIYMAETGRADILYPEYFIEADAPSDVIKGTLRRDHLALSKDIPGGPIAFMKRKGETDNYNGDFLNLKGERIGVVRGYQNTPEFDKLMDQGFFNIDEVSNDVLNARKLVKGRVNLIVGDPSVIRHSISNDDKLSQEEKVHILNTIEVVKPVLKYNHLYYAVSKKRPEWKTLLKDLNEAIVEFDTSEEMVRIIRETNANCGFIMDTLMAEGRNACQPVPADFAKMKEQHSNRIIMKP